MKTFLLIRFNRVPEEDVILINTINGLTYNNQIKCIETPSTILVLFKSKHRHKEIYIEIGKIKPIVAFFLIDITDVDFCINMPDMITQELMTFLGKSYVNKAEYSEDLSINELKKLLQDAIDDQNYELAAGIRDKIKVKKENNNLK
jgi:hypothetical protein